MNKNILISFIIPAYNAENTLEKCIKHIKKQKYQKEIIVVNDGSKDNTEKICKNEKITCITTKNQGASAARNRGINEANGDYIALIDSDVYLRKDWAEKVMKNDFSKYDYIITPCINNSKDKTSLEKIVKKDNIISYNNLMVFGNGAIFTKKNKSDTVFDEDFIVGGEDWDILLTLLEKNKKILFDIVPNYEHYHKFSNQKTRITRFLKKKIYFAYGDMLCFFKHYKVKQIRHFFWKNIWILPIFPFIYINKKVQLFLKFYNQLKERK